jgi:tRNA U34 2-thiouridine synthase MnmA/TrmU
MQIKKRAVALISGGLDSTLSAIIIAKQGIEVFGIQFLTPFGCDAEYNGHCVYDVNSIAKRFGFHIKLCPAGQDYINMVENPKFGYGKNMNPCIDCRIFMLEWAKDYMKEVGAYFLITGEVLNQRPLSQRKHRFLEIDKSSGLSGFILRPLSAKLLPPTIPEQEGIVDREKLYAIEGRSRHIQLQLAKEFGLQDNEIAQPASGCLLTDPGFSARLKTLFSIKKGNTEKEIKLMKLGRHFKLSENALLIIARNEEESHILEQEFNNLGLLIKSNAVGPTGLIYNSKSEEEIELAVKIISSYYKKLPQNEELKFFIDNKIYSGIQPLEKNKILEYLIVATK